MNKIPETIKHLIIINVLFYLASVVIKQVNLSAYLDLHFVLNPHYQPWQFITYMFMHSKGSFTHILFNMLVLFFAGPTLIQIWGDKKFIFFYLSCGIGAGLFYTGINYLQYTYVVSNLENMGYHLSEIQEVFRQGKYYLNYPLSQVTSGIYNIPTVGASGAISGLMMAYLFYFPNAKMYLYFLIPVTIKYILPIYFLFDLVMGTLNLIGYQYSGIAHFAHIGGAIIGAIMSLRWKKNPYNRF